MLFTDKKKNLRKIGLVFLWSSAIVLFIFLILYILSSNFSYLFENFHTVFFPQGNYMFSEESLLITLFPFGFFYQYFIRLVISSSIIAILLVIIGTACIFIQKKKERRFKIGK